LAAMPGFEVSAGAPRCGTTRVDGEEISMSELTHDATSRTLETPKGTLHYHEAGDGPPLLLLHGSGPGVSGWANFRGNLPTFAEHFRTLVLDMPGFGKSYSCEGNPLLAAPPAVVDFLDGMSLDSLAILGNSMGGNVAARLAAEHPDRVSRLVTIGGVGLALFSPSPPEGIKLLVQFVEDPTRERLMAWMESMVYDTAILTDEFVEMRWQAAMDPGALADIKKLFNFQALAAMRDRAGSAADSVAMLSKIAAPTLITYGRDDRVTPLDSALVPMRLIKQCEMHVFYNCGHWAMIERKDEFESVVVSFLMRDLPR
jgi:pimeloyl-ACP methyl ester carboxylesterase